MQEHKQNMESSKEKKQPPASDEPWDDMVDIRHYLRVLVKHWWIILLATLVPALLALACDRTFIHNQRQLVHYF